MSIKSFLINTNKKSITINFINGDTACLNFEYLRIATPVKNSSAKQTNLVTHKKLVLLNAIENVGKHGYRFIFDDQHSAIYTESYLDGLCQRNNELWQQYLNELKASGHSREAMITITEL